MVCSTVSQILEFESSFFELLYGVQGFKIGIFSILCYLNIVVSKGAPEDVYNEEEVGDVSSPVSKLCCQK